MLLTSLIKSLSVIIMPEITASFSNRRILLFYANFERRPWPVMPIGVCCIASALQNRGHFVRVVDLMFVKEPSSLVKQAIVEFQPEFIGVSVRNIDGMNWFDNKSYLEGIRDYVIKPARECSDALIMLGGPAINIAPQRLAKVLEADCAVFGDGEGAAISLVEAYRDSKLYYPLPFIAWNKDSCSRHDLSLAKEFSLQAYQSADIDCLPNPEIPKWINIKPYLRAGGAYPIQCKRGCAFNCSYCVYVQIEGRSYRKRSPERVAEEIAALHHQHGIWQFEFADAIFNHPAEYAQALCQAIIKTKVNVSLSTTAVNAMWLTPKLLALMEQAGFSDYSIAPESASAKVMQRLGKGYVEPGVLLKAAEVVRSSKIPVLWFFSFGLPGEDLESVEQSIKFIKEQLRPTDVALCTIGVRIYPGAPLELIAQTEGQLKGDVDILEQKYYVPPAISLNEIERHLRAAQRHLPNIWFTSDSGAMGKASRLCAALRHMFRIRQPIWQLVPLINRTRQLFY